MKKEWRKAALKHGFEILGRALDRYWLVLNCKVCKTVQLKRLNVVRDHAPICHHCIHIRRISEAEAAGAALLSEPSGDRKYGLYKLTCGHTVRRQYSRVQTAAAGGYKLGCDECREARYAREAEVHGWRLIGPASDGRLGYRQYQHSTCGHTQDVMIGNMAWGDCSCGKCGQGWPSKPSFIYLFKIDLPGNPVLKLGYSARPQKRLKHQLGLDRAVNVEVPRVLPMLSGHDALTEETACHRSLLKERPDLIVPKDEFGSAINTQSEIYKLEASEIINGLLDRIEQRNPSDRI
ncbi:hypothetical protein [uncultured Shimia sp.]|uniref:hypothetical protein n=1 Tax=uncultured Shimia sp. TaxID=573152 RepID=UPI00260A0C3D|nr:hypothetical protein [uncultured Shimia sp.]